MDVLQEIETALTALHGIVDPGEPIDELSHALQGFALARADGADDGLAVATLLHDLARSPALPDGPHDRVVRDWLDPRLGPRTAWLAGAHVQAKRWLAATEPGYALSPVSTASLEDQGGAGTDGLPTEHPWWPDAIRLRRYDDGAKVPGAPVPSIAEAMAVVARVAS